VRGDGVDIPPFIIIHTYKNASAASGRRCGNNEAPIRGMDIPHMIEYINHISKFVTEQSLLVMDRLSSHTSAVVHRHIDSKLLPNGEKMFIPLLLPPKTAFLISPLDMGAISAFKSHFVKYDRSTIELKRKAVQLAWDNVSNESLANICFNCGVVGEETLERLEERFMKEVVGLIPEEMEDLQNFYDSWISGAINVEGATRGRGITMKSPGQLSDLHLDGVYWTNFGRKMTPQKIKK
jgi:hypothetical protein